jgi:hypothetical protein
LPINSSFKCFSSYQLFFKVAQFAVYLLSLTLGAFGLIKITAEKKVSLLFLFISLITITLFLELRTGEIRYVSQLVLIFMLGLVDYISHWKYLYKLG